MDSLFYGSSFTTTEKNVLLKKQNGTMTEACLYYGFILFVLFVCQLVLDFGKSCNLSSLHYQPSGTGIISNYAIYAGNDLNQLRLVTSGEFSNIKNNPIMQDVYFTPTDARYLVLKAVRMIDDSKKINYEKLVVQ